MSIGDNTVAHTQVGRVKPPYITPELIEYLDNIFKDKCPDIAWTDREVWFNAGRAAVVRHLKQLKQQQDNNLLTRDIT